MNEEKYRDSQTVSAEDPTARLLGGHDTLLSKLWREQKMALIVSACVLLVTAFWNLGLMYALSYALLADLALIELMMKPKQARMKAETVSKLAARGSGGSAPLRFDAELYARYTAMETSLFRFLLFGLTAGPLMLNSLLQSILHYGTVLRMLFVTVFLVLCAGAAVFYYNINAECSALDRLCAEKREQNRMLFNEFGEEPLPFLD